MCGLGNAGIYNPGMEKTLGDLERQQQELENMRHTMPDDYYLATCALLNRKAVDAMIFPLRALRELHLRPVDPSRPDIAGETDLSDGGNGDGPRSGSLPGASSQCDMTHRNSTDLEVAAVLADMNAENLESLWPGWDLDNLTNFSLGDSGNGIWEDRWNDFLLTSPLPSFEPEA